MGTAVNRTQPIESQNAGTISASSFPPQDLRDLDKKITAVVQAKNPALSNLPISTMFTVSDIGSEARNFFVNFLSYLGLSLPKEGTVQAGYAYNSLMIASGFNAPIGLYSTIKNGQRMAAAAELGDGIEYIDAGLSLAATTTQAIGGAGVLLYVPLALTSTALGASTSLTSPSLLGRTTYGIGQVISAVFGIFYFLLGAAAGFNLFHQIKFYSQYYAAKKRGEKIAALENKNPRSEEENQKLQALKNEGDAFDFIKKKLSLTEKETARLNQLESPTGSQEKLREEAKKMLPKLSPDVKMNKEQWQECFRQIGVDALNKIGRIIMEKKLLQKHENQLKKVTGSAFIEDIRGIKDLTQVSEDKKAAILKKVESAWTRKMIINTLIAVAAAFGVLTTLAGFIFTAGIPAAIVTLVLLTAVIVPMALVDSYALYIELKHETPGKHDEKFLAISSLVAIAAMITSISLICSFNFAFLPIIFTLAIGSIWLALNGFSYTRIKKRRKELEKIQPPTNPLSEALLSWKNATYPELTSRTVTKQ